MESGELMVEWMKKALDMESKGFSSMESIISRAYSAFKSRGAHADPFWEIPLHSLPVPDDDQDLFRFGRAWNGLAARRGRGQYSEVEPYYQHSSIRSKTL